MEAAIERIEDFENSDEIHDMDINISRKTILKWYHNYNSHGHFPNLKMLNGKAMLPTLLDLNHD